MKSVASIFTAPALCLMLLGGMALEKRSHTKPEDAAPYHARAKAAIDAWPLQIGKDWTSRAWKIPDAAVQLLRPNTTLSPPTRERQRRAAVGRPAGRPVPRPE